MDAEPIRRFVFSRHGLDPKEARLQRLLEMVPAALSLTVLAVFVLLSFAAPIAAALLILSFELYWLLRILHGVLFLVLSYIRLIAHRRTDWLARIRDIDRRRGEEAPAAQTGRWPEKIDLWLHRRKLRLLLASGQLPPRSQELYHVVILPVMKESKEILEPAIASIARSDYPLERILLVIALEERARPEIHEAVRELTAEYRSRFMDLVTVLHPDGLEGEARVKGANVTCAARWARSFFAQRGIPDHCVLASCFDADTVVGPEYFSCLTYAFLVTPDRERASFQPIPVYHNNLWDVPGYAQVMETGSSFFILTELTHTEKLVTFSSHSMSFKALVEVGYWPVDMISDDSSIFWKAYLHYDGDYRVIPIYTTLSMDVVDGGSFRQTTLNIYKQKRRWAWGVEGFPILVRGLLCNRRIPVDQKIRRAFRFIEGHVSWATWSFLLSLSWLPAFMATREFSDSATYYQTQRLSSMIFTSSYALLAIVILLSLLLLPQRKPRHAWFRRIVFVSQWFLLPVIYVALSALPALDAQIRLMRGRYMEFWVTDKRRAGPQPGK